MMRLLASLTIYLLALALLAWLVGLGAFLMLVPARIDTPPTAKADAIVTFTGGAGRVQEGLELLREGYASQLFISGVGQGVTLEKLMQLHASEEVRDYISDRIDSSRITLGYEALNTIGNATETEAWVRKHSIRSLYLVTGHYHMPRARMELESAMPWVMLYEYPVFPRTVESGPTVLVQEYHKYILAWWRQWLRHNLPLNWQKPLIQQGIL
jgi:uncharacterized SAM-binding protein YcdF (DUF218 family)